MSPRKTKKKLEQSIENIAFLFSYAFYCLAKTCNMPMGTPFSVIDPSSVFILHITLALFSWQFKVYFLCVSS